MCTALCGIDVVTEAKYLFLEFIYELESTFYFYTIFNVFIIGYLMYFFFIVIKCLNISCYSFFFVEYNLLLLSFSRIFIYNSKSRIKICRFMKSAFYAFSLKLCLFKNSIIRLKGYTCSCIVLSAGTALSKSITYFSSFISLLVYYASLLNLNLKPFRKSVNNRCTYTMKSAGYLISAVTKLTSCMKYRKNNFYCRDSCLWMYSDRNSSSII